MFKKKEFLKRYLFSSLCLSVSLSLNAERMGSCCGQFRVDKFHGIDDLGNTVTTLLFLFF